MSRRTGRAPAPGARGSQAGDGPTADTPGRDTPEAAGRPGTTRGGKPRSTPGRARSSAASTENPGWTIFSYLLGGMAVYGGLGWLIGRWAGHQPIFLALGMVIGLALAITLTILRFGRS